MNKNKINKKPWISNRGAVKCRILLILSSITAVWKFEGQQLPQNEYKAQFQN